MQCYIPFTLSHTCSSWVYGKQVWCSSSFSHPVFCNLILVRNCFLPSGGWQGVMKLSSITFRGHSTHTGKKKRNTVTKKKTNVIPSQSQERKWPHAALKHADSFQWRTWHAFIDRISLTYYIQWNTTTFEDNRSLFPINTWGELLSRKMKRRKTKLQSLWLMAKLDFFCYRETEHKQHSVLMSFCTAIGETLLNLENSALA